ncbi:CAP domain-containing protein [Lacrimispora sp. 38-1]|uniref:CAP domain-containing protein n=1 Tax=Lacrimispora sp. 38-1 TaxID=3125778 RepID=UPI003CEA3CAE
MKKLKAIGLITLTLTSMLPLTANAAVNNSYRQCYGGRNVTAIYGSCNASDLRAKLQQLGINSNNLNWSCLTNGNSNKTGNCSNGNGSNTNNGNTNTGNTNTGNTNTGNTNTGNTNTGNTNTGNTNTGNTNSGNTNTGSTNSGSTTNKTYTQQVVDLVNAERAKAGLAPLTIDANVEKAANVRANEIQTSFEHVRPNGSSFSTAIKEQNVNFRGAGENIAWGQKTPQEVMNAWMNSAGHRANILNKSFTHIGVGNVQNGAGTQYWVQLFTY